MASRRLALVAIILALALPGLGGAQAATQAAPALPGWPGAVACSPDGRRALSAWGNSLKLWDLESGAELMTFSGHADSVSSVAFSADGLWAVSGSRDRTVRFWDLGSGKPGRDFQEPDPVLTIAVSPDGKYLLAAGPTVTLWDLGSGKSVFRLMEPGISVEAAAFSADGTRFLLADSPTSLGLWESAGARFLRRFAKDYGRATSVAFSPDGRQVLAANAGKFLLWETEGGSPVARFPAEWLDLSAIAYSPDGSRVLAAGGGENSVVKPYLKLWDSASGKELRSWRTAKVSFLACATGGSRLVTSDASRSLKVWDLSDSWESRSLAGHAGALRSASFSADGSCAISASNDGTARLWNSADGAPLQVFRGHSGAVIAAALSPAGNLAASGGDDKTVRLWDCATGGELRSLAGHSSGVTSLAFLPDGKRLLSASYDWSLRLWELDSGRELRSFRGHAGAVLAFALSPDGKRALTASADASLKLWDIEGGRELATFGGHRGPVNGVAFLPDGLRAISVSADQTARIWELSSGKQLGILTVASPFRAFALSPDGGRFLTGDYYEPGLVLWDSATMRWIWRYPWGEQPTACLAWSGDGRQILSGAGEGQLWIWNLAYVEPLRVLAVAGGR